MDLRRIETFRLVALHGSLRHAANHCSLTVPAVSIQIKTLEQELGVELFHRLPNRLVLTDRGRLFLSESTKIVAAMRHAADAISGKELPESEISLAMGGDLTQYFAPTIAQIIQDHASTKLSLVTASSFRGLSLLLDGSVDLSLGFYNALPKGLHRYKLFQTGMSLVFDPHHFDIDVDRVDLKQLSKYRIMMMRVSRTRKQIDSVLARRGVVFDNILEVGSCQSAMDFARLGLGVGLVHDVCATQFRRELTQINMTRTFGRFDVAVAMRPETLLSGSHKAFVDSLIRKTRLSARSEHSATDSAIPRSQ